MKDNFVLLIASVVIQIAMRITSSALLSMAPGISTSLSVFVPIASFLGTYVILVGNTRLSAYTLTNTLGNLQHEEVPLPIKYKWLRKLIVNVFSVKNTSILNAEFRSNLLYPISYYY